MVEEEGLGTQEGWLVHIYGGFKSYFTIVSIVCLFIQILVVIADQIARRLSRHYAKLESQKRLEAYNFDLKNIKPDEILMEKYIRVSKAYLELITTRMKIHFFDYYTSTDFQGCCYFFTTILLDLSNCLKEEIKKLDGRNCFLDTLRLLDLVDKFILDVGRFICGDKRSISTHNPIHDLSGAFRVNIEKLQNSSEQYQVDHDTMKKKADLKEQLLTLDQISKEKIELPYKKIGNYHYFAFYIHEEFKLILASFICILNSTRILRSANSGISEL